MYFLPHGYCFGWRADLLWSMAGADALIAIAYFSIPIAIMSFVWQRGDSSLNWIAWLFSAFIFACGVTHVLDVWTIWQPAYRLQALVKIVAAAISVVTAVVLWPIIPKALKIPSVAQLQAVIGSLEAEAQRRQHAEDGMIDSQQILAVTLASIGAGFIATDRKGNVTRMNAVAEQVTGWTEDEARGHILWDVFARESRLPEDARENPVDVTIRRQITVENTYHVNAIARDGKRMALELKCDLTRGSDGRVRGMAMIFRDMSRLINAEEAARRLEAENRQIQEASRLKSLFVANISHELRTPLNAIIGFSDLLHSGIVPPESPKHREFIGFIGTSGRHLLKLINDVLDLSKVEAGKLEFFPEPIRLTPLVTEVVDILQTAAEPKNIRIQLDIDPSLGELVLDPSRLKQVLYNYLSNAIKFTPDGGRVMVRARPEGAAHFRMEVDDSGIGIAEVDLPRLFNDFQQLDAGMNKQHQGTGLGLSLARRLVEAQGGTVGVSSVLGCGSVFYLLLNRIHGTDTPRNAA